MTQASLQTPTESGKPRMLVVDDEPENVALMRRMFRTRYEVNVAGSGNEALSKLEHASYEVIITDQMMPGMTGTEFLTQSLALAPEAIRILVTGFPDLASAISSINEGRAYRFFTKPIDRAELVDAVNTALARQHAADEFLERIQELERENAALEAANARLEHRIEHEVQARSSAVLDELASLRARDPFDDESGLANRVSVAAKLEAEVARSERYGMLVLVRAVAARQPRRRRPDRGDRPGRGAAAAEPAQLRRGRPLATRHLCDRDAPH